MTLANDTERDEHSRRGRDVQRRANRFADELRQIADSPPSRGRPRLTRDQKIQVAVELMIRGYSGPSLERMLQQRCAASGGELLKRSSAQFIITAGRGVFQRHLDKPLAVALGEAVETWYSVLRSSLDEFARQVAAIKTLDAALDRINHQISETRSRRGGNSGIVPRGQPTMPELAELRNETIDDLSRALARRAAAVREIAAIRKEISAVLAPPGTRDRIELEEKAHAPESLSDPQTAIDAIDEIQELLRTAADRVRMVDELATPPGRPEPPGA